jgi:hypothetical protein
MKRAMSVALVVAFLFCLPARAWACSCIGPSPACQVFAKTDAVFEGRVVSIEAIGHSEALPGTSIRIQEKLVTLEVRQAWKGPATTRVQVVTASQGSACGIAFKAGERYLVFANHRSYDGRLGASSCGNTRRLDEAADSLAFLDSLSRPADGGRVFGSVKLYERVSRPGTPSERPFDLAIRLTGGGREVTSRSVDGTYEFRGLSPGSYAVDVTPPDGYMTYGGTSRPAEISDDRSCAQLDFGFSAAGKIDGRLLDLTGRPIPNLRLEIGDPTELRGDSNPSVAVVYTDPDGYFVFEGLSPGRYMVAVNARDLPSDFMPYARSIYPGNTSGEIIEIGLGQTVQLQEWRLPAPPAVRTVSILVRWRDGLPASGLRVQAWDTTHSADMDMRGAGYGTTDAEGRFTLRVRSGRRYTLTASATGMPRTSLQPERLVIDPTASAVTLTVPFARPGIIQE